MDDSAMFYPNICMFWKVRLADGPKVFATTDAMALTHDRRHFIDCRLVRSLSNGKELMDGLLPADPACIRLAGTKSNDRVLGMLAQPLVFTSKLPITTNGEKRLSRVVLDKVLVIEHLPVPLHVSFLCLQDSGLVCSMAMGKGMTHKSPELSISPKAPSSMVYVLTDADFEAENLPAEYQAHPYWEKSNVVQLGHCGVAPTTSQMAIMEQSRGHNSVDAMRCRMCPSGVNLRLCARCKAVHYCSKECQRVDWPRHKVECTRR
jgi:hypothetical protein